MLFLCNGHEKRARESAGHTKPPVCTGGKKRQETIECVHVALRTAPEERTDVGLLVGVRSIGGLLTFFVSWRDILHHAPLPRFLKQYRYNVPKTADVWAQYLQWRNEYGAEDVLGVSAWKTLMCFTGL